MIFFRLLSLCTFMLFLACSHEYVKPENYKHPQISIDTEFGSMVAELYEEKAPVTVSNFIVLAEDDFYKDMLFHSIVKGVYVQGGCPNTKIGAQGRVGSGGPGYTIKTEINDDLTHSSRGMLTMAGGRAGVASGSQFMILFGKVPVFDGRQTVFGKIIKGEEVLSLIEKMAGPNGAPKREISFSIKVLSKNDIEYKVTKNEK